MQKIVLVQVISIGGDWDDMEIDGGDTLESPVYRWNGMHKPNSDNRYLDAPNPTWAFHKKAYIEVCAYCIKCHDGEDLTPYASIEGAEVLECQRFEFDLSKRTTGELEAPTADPSDDFDDAFENWEERREEYYEDKKGNIGRWEYFVK